MSGMRKMANKIGSWTVPGTGWMASLEVWWLVGFIGIAVFGACLANTGTDPGSIEPRFKWIWSVGGALCLALTQGIRTLEARRAGKSGQDVVE